MKGENMLDAVKLAVSLAQVEGAGEVAASAYRIRQVDVTLRDGKLEKITEATSRGLSLDLYVEGRYSSVSTNDLRPDALGSFIAEAVALTRKLTPDPARMLPDPTLYRGQADLDLDLEDPCLAEIDPIRRRQMAEAIESGVRGAERAEVILSSTATCGDMLIERFQVHSNGFEGSRRTTDFWMAAEVSVADPDGRRPEDWDAASARHLVSLSAPAEVGRRAAERSISRLNTVKGDSAVLPMLVENRAAGRLVGMLFAPLGASALQQKRSFLDGRLGQRIGSERLDIRDNPLVVRGLGSRLFDGEGIAAKPFPIFELGALKNYYVDAYYGRKLGLMPTTARASNLDWRLGTKPLARLLAEVGEGIMVTGFLGGNSNGTTGDFSLGVNGFRIRNGALAEPVGEMNIAGNHLSLWNRLAEVGDDPYPYSPMRTPTLLFDGLQFAGK